MEPSGALVTGTRTGALLYVAGGSAVAVIASSFDQVRGVAYDAAGKRLFVIDHGVIVAVGTPGLSLVYNATIPNKMIPEYSFTNMTMATPPMNSR